jgi:hypothetical protein
MEAGVPEAFAVACERSHVSMVGTETRKQHDGMAGALRVELIVEVLCLHELE